MSAFPILGVDTSVWEGPINCDQTVRGGATFIMPKAGEANFVDRQFRPTWTNAKGKLYRSAFWFLSINYSIKEQALKFANLLYPDHGEIEPYVDYEQERVFWVAKNPVTGLRGWNHLQFSHLNGFIIYFEAEIVRLFGRWPWKNDTGIYTGYSYWKDFAREATNSDVYRKKPLWISCPDPVDKPHPLAPWGDNWKFWQMQFSADGPTYGTDKYQARSIDLNCYNGDMTKFVSEYGVISGSPTPPVPDLPPFPEYPPGFPKTGQVTESQVVDGDVWGRLAEHPDQWIALVFDGMNLVHFNV